MMFSPACDRQKRTLAVVLAFTTLLTSLLTGAQPSPVQAASPNIVISQVYGGGGNTGATYKNDFIELFNRGGTTVSLAGWSVQYTSASGTGNFGATPTQITELPAVSLAPGQYYLIQEAAGNSCSGLPCGADLPVTPDFIDGTPINISGTGGKVALVNTTTPLGCNGGSTACPPSALAQIVDLIGWDGANFYEGSGPAPGTTATTADLRSNAGCTDTDDNAADFAAGTPTPRNSSSPAHSCSGPTNPSGTGAATPNAVYPGDSTLLTVSVTPGVSPPSTGITVSGDLSSIGGSNPQSFYDDGSHGDATAGDNVFSFQIAVGSGTTPGSKSLPISIADAQSRSATTSISLTVRPPLVRIHDIQGASHISPKKGALVTTQGIVTAKRSNGFYVQDPTPDGSDATSEAIFVFTSSAPGVNVGDAVLVTGTVKEFRPGGASGAVNLTTTEIDNPGRSVSVLSGGNPLPPSIVIGNGGRIPPGMVIEDDASGDVENSGVFDPGADGIDFYESLEGMLVQVNNAVAVGPTNSFGELPVVGDNGANAGVRTTRGGIVIRPNDSNPERILLDDEILRAASQSMPPVSVGDHFSAPAVGVVDYSFGNFKLELTQSLTGLSGGLSQETTTQSPAYQLAVATFNVENLNPNDPPSKFDTLARLIVNNLRSPDVVAVEEIQDNNGATDNGVVDATTTWNRLIQVIQSVGGPPYQFRQIDPVNNQDGGEPGGNIRQGFLFRTDRGLAFVDRPGGNATMGTAVTGSGPTTRLTYSPGRIDPANTAFNSSRKPLAGEFTFKGDKVFVIANHFNSKGGDQPLFGHFQPPNLSSEVQRNQQAQIVRNFVTTVLAADPQANIVVLGDLNDFEFSSPLMTLKGAMLNDLIESLPQNERYTYVFDGNSQALDHILVSNGPYNRPRGFDVLHVNSEFAVQASDHDPGVAHLCVDATPPSLTVGVLPNTLWPPLHQYATVNATINVTDNADPSPVWKFISAVSNEPDNGLGDGDQPNDIVKMNDVTFQLRAERSALGAGRAYTLTYQAADACANAKTASATVTVPHDMGN